MKDDGEIKKKIFDGYEMNFGLIGNEFIYLSSDTTFRAFFYDPAHKNWTGIFPFMTAAAASHFHVIHDE
jgi:hypothetical protein